MLSKLALAHESAGEHSPHCNESETSQDASQDAHNSTHRQRPKSTDRQLSALAADAAREATPPLGMAAGDPLAEGAGDKEAAQPALERRLLQQRAAHSGARGRKRRD